jgi:hypothetical protein
MRPRRRHKGGQQCNQPGEANKPHDEIPTFGTSAAGGTHIAHGAGSKALYPIAAGKINES